MNTFFNSLAGTAWTIVPVLLILFLTAGIVFVLYFKAKMEEISHYIKSIAISLEKMAGRENEDQFMR